MRNRNVQDGAQSVYLLEYGRRKIKVCADTFQNLAQIFGEEAEEGDTQEQERAFRLLKKRLAEGRQLFAGNLQELADMMNQAAEESVRLIRLGGRRQRRLEKGLRQEGLEARDIYLIRRGDGRMELSALLSARTKNSRTVEEAADYLSVLLDIRLISAKRNPFFIGREPVCYFFEEEPEYMYLTGTAKAVKETEEISGDNFSFFEAGDGNLTAVLSDGMGSGREACQDSEAVTDMAESMLESGVPPKMAAALMNSAVANGGTGERLPTLDMCSIDLYEGECLFLKTGAAASFIKHGNRVEVIEGTALPLGAFGRMDPVLEKRSFSDGDYIILMTDGMLEGWAGGDGIARLSRFLSGTEASSPGQLANVLMKYSIERQRGRIRDDMTVLAVGLWKREETD